MEIKECKVIFNSEQVKALAEEIRDLKEQLEEKDKEIERLNNIIDKAIEYIEIFDFDYLDSTYEHNARIILENILEILKGEDKE